MSKILIIAEKPDMGCKYAAALGGVFLDDGSELTTGLLTKKEKYIKSQVKDKKFFEGIATKGSLKGNKIFYCWCQGHLTKLCDASDYDEKYKLWKMEDFPFIPEKFKMNINSFTKDKFFTIKKLVDTENFDLIINACDPEREGELIFSDLSFIYKTNTSIKRLWLNSTSEKDIINGFSNLIEPNLNLLDSAKARNYADWIVGCNFTVISTLGFLPPSEKGVLSIGRVQTPVLNLIVQKEKQIKKFKSEKYYQIIANLRSNNINFHGVLTIDGEDKFPKETAEQLLKELKSNTIATVSNIENKREKELPPEFFNLTTLQAAANKLFGYTLTETLNILQNLYDKSFTTYPRTDSKFIPITEETNLTNRINYIDKKYDVFKNKALINIQSGMKLGNRYVQDTNDAHFALLINNYYNSSNLSEKHKNIYDLISKSMLAAYLGEALWNKSKIILKIGEYDFYVKNKKILKKGFRELLETKEETFPNLNVNIGDKISITKLELLEKETQKPKRYTDRSLVLTMENIRNLITNEKYKQILKDCKGIGTPATRADILDRIIKVGYVERKGKELIPTEKGLWVIENIPLPELKSVTLTAMWEEKLQNISNNKLSINDFMLEIKEFVIKNSAILKESSQNKSNTFVNKNSNNSIGKCPLCGNPVTENSKGYGCSNYSNGCKFFINKKIASKIISEKNVKQLLDKHRTTMIKGFKSKKGKEFDACLVLDKNNNYVITFVFEESKRAIIGKCAICDGNVQKGKYSYMCSNREKGCNFIINKQIAGKDISEKIVEELLQKGITSKIKGFKSKKGKEFSARLAIDKNDNYAIKFHFDD